MTTVAIDFGTSNTVVCILNPDTQTPETLRLGEISRIFKTNKFSGDSQEIPVVPTLVFVKGPGELVLGGEGREAIAVKPRSLYPTLLLSA